MRLIDADNAINGIEYAHNFVEQYTTDKEAEARNRWFTEQFIYFIKETPTVKDAVVVTRCKDCKHYDYFTNGLGHCAEHDGGEMYGKEYFCASAEKREE